MKKLISIIPFQTVNYRCPFGCDIVLHRLWNFDKYIASGACEHIEVVVEAAQPRVQLTGATGGDLSEASIDAPATDA